MIRDMPASAFARAIAPSRGAPTHPPLLAPARAGLAAAPAMGSHHGLHGFRAPDAPAADARAGRERGAPLPEPVRALMESALGFRFERVRIHADDHAARAAEARRAAAYTIGEDIVFGRRAYAPTRAEGLSLLAHELVHVAQWYNGGRPRTPDSHAMDKRPGFAPAPDSTGQAALEAEASDRVRGFDPRRPARVVGAARAARPLAHPVYISRHGGPAYLQAAARFYERWGYSPIRTGVDSIEEIVADLAGQPRTPRVTIVTHAAPDTMQIAFINGGPDNVSEQMWAIDTPGELPKLEHHSAEAIAHEDELARLLDQDAEAGPVLRRLGGVADPLMRAWLRFATERAYAELGSIEPHAVERFTQEAEADRQWLADLAEWRMAQYRDTILLGAAVVGGFGGPAPSRRDFVVLSRAARRLAPRIAFQPRTVAQHRYRIEPWLASSPTREVIALLRGRLPQFVANLTAVRRAMTSGSWVEIQGCRVGQNRQYLRGVQAFFGGGKGPRVTAPEWFQTFGSYRIQTVDDSPAALRRLWARQEVRDAFAYWHQVFTGSPPAADADERTLRRFLRAPNALPLTSEHPSPGWPNLMLLRGVEERAFLLWLTQHSHRLYTERALRSELLERVSMASVPIDWLQRDWLHTSPTIRVFRPDPEYWRHIIVV